MVEVHNHKKNMENLLVSINKFFGLDNDSVSLSKLNRFFEEEDYKNIIVLSYDCFDLKLFDKYLLEDSFLGSHRFFNITVPKCSEEDLAHIDLINRINGIDGCRAYGVFPFEFGAYSSLEEAYKRIINLSMGNDKRLIYVSFRGFYDATEDGLKKVNDDCFKLCNELDNSVILVLSESIVEDKKVPLCVIKRNLSSEKVRMASMKDLSVVNMMIEMAWRNRIEVRPDLFEKRRKITENEFYNYCNKARGETCLVYEISEEVVGFIFFRIKFIKNQDYLKDRSYLYIENIYVKEEFRNRGIGSKLYNEACNYGRKMKVKKVEISVCDFEEDLIKFIDSLNNKILSRTYEIDLVDVN